VRDGQTSPHRPRLGVSRSTCPPLSSPPPREQLCTRYCSNKTHTGTAVINTHFPHAHKHTLSVMGRLVHTGQTSPHRPQLVVFRSTCPPISPPPHANSFVLGPVVINTHTLSILCVHPRFAEGLGLFRDRLLLSGNWATPYLALECKDS
jgi:hypothetical protein